MFTLLKKSAQSSYVRGSTDDSSAYVECVAESSTGVRDTVGVVYVEVDEKLRLSRVVSHACSSNSEITLNTSCFAWTVKKVGKVITVSAILSKNVLIGWFRGFTEASPIVFKSFVRSSARLFKISIMFSLLIFVFLFVAVFLLTESSVGVSVLKLSG